MRLAARGVCAAIAQAWQRRRFKTPFIAKLCIAQSETASLQVWMDIAQRCGYLKMEEKMILENQCGLIMAQLHRMIDTAQNWLIRPSSGKKRTKQEKPGDKAGLTGPEYNVEKKGGENPALKTQASQSL